MTEELQKLIDYCGEIGAIIIRLKLDINFAIIQLFDGTPSEVNYKDGRWM